MPIADAEGNTEAFEIGENGEVRRSPQAVACKKRCAEELGKPQRAPGVGITTELVYSY